MNISGTQPRQDAAVKISAGLAAPPSQNISINKPRSCPVAPGLFYKSTIYIVVFEAFPSCTTITAMPLLTLQQNN